MAQKWDLKSALREAKKSKSRSAFMKKPASAYQWLARNKKLPELDSVLPRVRASRINWELNSALREAGKFKSRREFRRNAASAYLWLWRNKKLGELDRALPKRDLESALREAGKFKSRAEFTKKARSTYEWLRRHGKLGELDRTFPRLTTTTTWSLESALREAVKCKSGKEFRWKATPAYEWLRRNKKLEELNRIFPDTRFFWSLESVLNEAGKFKSRKEFTKKAGSAYEWLRRNKKLEELNRIFPKTKGHSERGSTLLLVVRQDRFSAHQFIELVAVPPVSVTPEEVDQAFFEVSQSESDG